MRQFEQDYREALDGMRFSHEAKERIMNNLMEENKRPVKVRRFRPLRTGLIAACLCLVLVGTAFAATAVYQMISVRLYSDHEMDGRQYVGYEVFGEGARYSLEDFSQELQDDYTSWDRGQGGVLPGREFDNWEDAKAYLGDSVPCTWRDTGDVAEDSTSVYRVQSIPDLTWDTNDLQYVMFYNCELLRSDMSLDVEIYIYAPNHTYDQLYGMGKPAGTEYQMLEDYAMANGCEATVILETGAEDWPALHSIGIFMKEGILYKVSLYGGAVGRFTEEEMVTQLHQVLDSFQ